MTNLVHHGNLIADNITGAGNNFVYTGLSVTIPANSFFAVNSSADWWAQTPTGCLLTTSNSDLSFYYRLAYSVSEIVRCSYSGFTVSPLTIYLWCRYDGTSAGNHATLNYGYITI